VNRELLLHIGIAGVLILVLWLVLVLLDPDERRRACAGVGPAGGDAAAAGDDGAGPVLTDAETERLARYEAALGKVPAGIISRGRGLADECRTNADAPDTEAARILLAVLDRVLAYRDSGDSLAALLMTINDLTIAAIDLTELARHEPAFDA
jgi:hypothetical protein